MDIGGNNEGLLMFMKDRERLDPRRDREEGGDDGDGFGIVGGEGGVVGLRWPSAIGLDGNMMVGVGLVR